MNLAVKPFKDQSRLRLMVLLLIVTILVFIFSNISFSAPGIDLGDVNEDGEINVLDAILVMDYTIGLQNLTGDQLEAADVNRDGRVNVQDATMIMQYVLRIGDADKVITSVEDVEITVSYGTELDKIDFPGRVKATMHDETERQVNVEWEDKSSPEYESLTPGDYMFKGELFDFPLGVTNPDGLQARAIVTLVEHEIPAERDDPDHVTAGFNVSAPANPVAGVAFTVEITEARGDDLEYLDGEYNVRITSSNVAEGQNDTVIDAVYNGTIFNENVLFSDGAAAINITLNETGEQELKVVIESITEAETVSVTVVSEDLSGANLEVLADPITAGNAVQITVSDAKDIEGEPVDGEEVGVTVTSNEDGEIFNSLVDFSDPLDEVQITTEILSTAAEHTLTVSIEGVADDQIATITLEAAVPVIMSAVPDSLDFIGQGESQVFTVTVEDEYSNPVAGENVSFEVTGQTQATSFTSETEVTGAQGEAVSYLEIAEDEVAAADKLTVVIIHESIDTIVIENIDVRETFNVSGEITVANSAPDWTSLTIELKDSDDVTLDKLDNFTTDGVYLFENITAGSNYYIEASMVNYKKGISDPFDLIDANIENIDVELVQD